MFFIGALAPTLSEFQVGPAGFSAKLRERDRDFTSVLGPEAESLTRIGTWLTGNPDAGRELVERALIETYMRWPQDRAGNPVDAVRERMVDLAPPANTGPSTIPQQQHAGGADDLLAKLIALPATERSALVLHLLEGLDTQAVASITRREPAAVAADIVRGAKDVVAGAAPPPGAAW
jgi:hypothetical protein